MHRAFLLVTGDAWNMGAMLYCALTPHNILWNLAEVPAALMLSVVSKEQGLYNIVLYLLIITSLFKSRS